MTYQLEFSQHGVNAKFSANAGGKVFPHAEQSVETVSNISPFPTQDFQIGVFLHPKKPRILVTNNNRGLTAHALANIRPTRLYLDSNPSNLPAFNKRQGDGRSIQFDKNITSSTSRQPIPIGNNAGYFARTPNDSPPLKGLSDRKSNVINDTLSIVSCFNEYSISGIRKILNLRMRTGKTNNLTVLPNYYSFSKAGNNIEQVFFDLRQTSENHVLVPLSLYDKHAVGVMFVAQGDGSGYKAFYLDPENATIPEDLAVIFKDNGYQIEQLPTEGQRYTNCGPEVIENFMLYLTGERLSQEEAIVNNSRLVEQELLSSSHEAEEASCLTPKDSYRKQDTVTVISNAAFNTQVSSDGYIICNPTGYDIVTPQTIIDGLVVRGADLGTAPRDLLSDYRINQDYAEAILGEIASIDIS